MFISRGLLVQIGVNHAVGGGQPFNRRMYINIY